MIANSRAVFDTPASHQDDGVFLEVVAFTWNVRGDLSASSQAYSGHLAQRGVGLLWGGGIHPGTYATPLRALCKRWGITALPEPLAPFANQLADGWQGYTPGRVRNCR